MKDEVIKCQKRIEELEKENSILKENLDLFKNTNLSHEIVSNANYGIIVYDTELRFQVWNPFMEKLSGISSQEILGKHPADFFPFLVENKVINRLEDILKSGKGFHYEYPFKNNNIEGWADDFSSAIKDAKNEITGIISIITDITERKKTEEELLKTKSRAEESANRLLSIIENTQAGYFFIDNDGLFQDVNKAWLNLYKYDRLDEVIGKHFAQVQQVEDIESAKQFVEGIRNGNPEYMNGDFSRKCKDGSIGFHSFSARPVYSNNEIIGIEGFLIDITEQKAIEIELKNQNNEYLKLNEEYVAIIKDLHAAKKQVELNEEKYKSLFTSMEEGVYLHDVVYNNEGNAINYRIIEANPSSEKHLKIKAEEAIGKLATELFQTSEAPFLDVYAEVAKTGKPFSIEQYFEPMDKWFYISVFSPQKGQFATAFFDITKTKQSEKELIETKNRAEESELIFRKLFEDSSDAILLIDKSGVFVECNQAALNLLKLTREEFLFQPPVNISPEYQPDGRKSEEAALDMINLAYQKGLHRFDWTCVNAEGAEFIVEVSLMPIVIKGQTMLHTTWRDITGRKYAVEKIRVAEENMKNTFNLSPSIISKANLITGFFIEASSAVKRILGYTIEEFTSKPIKEFIHPDDRQRTQDEIAAQIQGKEVTFFENRYLCKNGSYKWMAWHGTLADKDGIVTAIGSDIDERKLAEIDLQKAKEKAEENEERYRSLLNNLEAGVVVHAADTAIIMSNQRASELLGLSIEQMNGKVAIDPAWKFVYEDNSPIPLKDYPVMQILNTKKAIKNHVFGVYRKTNDLVWVIVNGFPVTNNNNEISEIVISFIDITEHKQAELELKKAKEKAEESEKALKHSHDLLKYIIEHNRSAIAIHDKNFRYVYVSQRYLKDYKLEGQDIIGKHHYDVFPDLPQRWRDVHIKALEGIVSSVEDDVYPKADGTIEWARWECRPWYENDNSIGGFIIYTEVITERKNMELALKAAKERAEESDRLKTAFLQNMSHEIRTPMNAIMGFSGLLVRNFNDKNKLQKFSTIIGQRCNDLLDIINDILDISKIESGQLDLNNEKCNLKELFAELSAFFAEYRYRIGKQHLNFSLHAFDDPNQNIIITDKVKLKQIFINLITNAFKFTEDGSIEGGCKFDKNNQAVFYVSDTGIGIPVDKQQFIYERFTQVHLDSRMNIGGTGLGLSIVRGLVELLGGKIALESQPGKGSTFSFTISYENASNLAENKSPTKQTNTDDFLNKTILIVEDDLYNAEYLKEILLQYDFNIVHTEFGNQAFDISLKQHIDLILMDIRLPDVNGYEVTRKIRLSKPDIKIIAQTAYAAHDEKQKAMDAGCIDYISKPTNQDLLVALISKYLSA